MVLAESAHLTRKHKSEFSLLLIHVFKDFRFKVFIKVSICRDILKGQENITLYVSVSK